MRTTVSIPGIHCEGCAKLIKEISSESPAITTVNVDLTTKRVTLDHTDAFDYSKWKEEVEASGETYRISEIVSGES